MTDGRIVVRDPAPLGDPNLDEALAGLAGLREVPVAKWMADLPSGFVGRLLYPSTLCDAATVAAAQPRWPPRPGRKTSAMPWLSRPPSSAR